ncbi:MAG: YafY family transcriptional regulator [Actinomycetia bacterium]|nr:YafY family transcriptional regulator [Actinomycetes bacterium]
MESPAARLLALLSLLQTRPHWNAPELAERLGITERTVRRDVTRLRDLGYPVEAAPGRTGGYQLGRGGALPPLLLADDEAVAVALGLRAAATGGVAGYDEAAVAAMAKLEQVLPVHLRERVLALSSAIVLVRSGGGRPVGPDCLLLLAQGCRRGERVTFCYVAGDGSPTDRRVEPYGVVNVDRRWYLVAWDLDRDDWRTFRLDRMSEPALTGHRFTPRDQPDTAAMVLDGLTHTPYAWQAEVLVRAELDEVAADVPASVGTLEAVEGGTIVRMGANDLDWIARYLAGLEHDFEVLRPSELKAELRALGRRLQRAHR